MIELEPLAPADAIAAYEARRGRLTETFSWEDLFQDEHATQLTVAKSAGFSILKDIDAALVKALAEGQTLAQFSRDLTPALQAAGWWGRKDVVDPSTGEFKRATLGSPRRLKTIFETNLRVSYAAGHWAAFERAKVDRPYLRYVCVLDEATRPAHRARHNLVLPVDHPYWNSWAPPCGWGCRCTLQSLSERDIARLQREGERLFFEPPADTTRTYVNRRTGEVSEVPDGIDPGWAYNPGKAGFRAMQATTSLSDAPPDLAAAAAAVPDWLLRPTAREFPDWFDQAAAGGRVEPAIVVAGVFDPTLLTALRSRGIEPASGAVTLSQRTVRHMIRDTKTARGASVPIEVLRHIPEHLDTPRAVLLDRRDGAVVYVFDVPGETKRAGKLVVRVDFGEKARGESGRQDRIMTNSVRTAGMTDLATLRNAGAYDLLSGSLGESV